MLQTKSKQNASIISTYREFRDQKYIQGGHIEKRMPQSEVLPEIVTRKCTTKECYYSKYTQGMTQSNILPGSATSQYGCKGVSQSKDCQGISRQMSIKIKRIAGNLTIKVLPGSATLLMTKGSIIVKTTVMVNHNQNDCQ